MKTYTLENGIQLPAIAFGTYEINDPNVFVTAMKKGYRFFDTASFYRNEEALGKAIASAVKDGILTREELIIGSKCWRDEMGYDGAKKAFYDSISRLKVDYLDLYYIHWPRPNLIDENWPEISRETWRALEDLYKEGVVRSIGISNFLIHHMENLLTTATITPMCLQLELHPGYLQKESVKFAREHGMTILGWSPLGKNRLTDDETLKRIAKKYEISVQSLCLAFEATENIIPLPKTVSEVRMEQNLKAIDIKLQTEDLDTILAMKQSGWSGEHPDHERIKDMSMLNNLM